MNMDGFEAPTGRNVARDQDTEERADLSSSPRQQPHQGRLGGHASRGALGWVARAGRRSAGRAPAASGFGPRTTRIVPQPDAAGRLTEVLSRSRGLRRLFSEPT